MIHHTTDCLKVKVYFNLHRKCFSIMADEGPAKGKVIAHADDVILGKVTSKVSEAGRDRVRRTKRKEVHAYVCGELLAWGGPNGYSTEAARGLRLPFPLAGCWDVIDTGMAKLIDQQGVNLTYNPYTHDYFKLASGAAFVKARYCLLSTVMGRKVLA